LRCVQAAMDALTGGEKKDGDGGGSGGSGGAGDKK
jgi:hypothetical protein